jgi:flagellar basal-body rod protein FlgB
MKDLLFSESSFQTAKLALDGLTLRQQVISRNLSNVDTPGYHAESVNFEDAFKKALNQTSPLALTRTNAAHLASPVQPTTGFAVNEKEGGTERADGNNVDIDQELIDMSEAGIRYQSVSQAVSKKLVLLKAIASSV